MLKIVVAVCAISLTVSAAAQAPVTPQTQVPRMPRDEKIDRLASDLQALSRVAALAKDLSDVQQVMLAILNADIDMLREPRENGTYRWASLQREESSRVRDEKSVERVSTEKELREVTITAVNAYRVEVKVPEKRNLFSGNNRVFVRNVLVDSTSFDGKTTHHDIPVNAWINPGDSNGVALPDIGKSVKATAELGVERGDKAAVAQVALLQAKLVDDPTSPYFPAVKRLLQIRDFVSKEDINRGNVKNAVDEALLSLPGELEKRVSELVAAEEKRKQLATSGTIKGTIAVGDATPDVIAALNEISRLLGGTLQDQTDARAKLKQLIETLQPKPSPMPKSP